MIGWGGGEGFCGCFGLGWGLGALDRGWSPVAQHVHPRSRGMSISAWERCCVVCVCVHVCVCMSVCVGV